MSPIVNGSRREQPSGIYPNWAVLGAWNIQSTASETIRAAIENEVQFFEELGRDFEWKVFDHDQPVNLREELHAHGFAVGQCEALLVRPLTAAKWAGRKQPSHPVKPFTGIEHLDDYLTVTEQVWGRKKVADQKISLQLCKASLQALGFMWYTWKINPSVADA